jgi:hypothetical protein
MLTSHALEQQQQRSHEEVVQMDPATKQAHLTGNRCAD